jgi:hypothetical protein
MIKTLLLGLVISSFFVLFTLAAAQEATPLLPTPSPVVYTLPYPGIMPNHPLYFLKALRDQLLMLLITEPVKKVEFRLLLAEKSLNTSIFLTQQHNKQALAVKTLTQGSEYLKTAETLLAQAPTSSDRLNNVKDRFGKLLTKYTEVVRTLTPQFSDEYRQGLITIEQQLTTLSARVTEKK